MSNCETIIFISDNNCIEIYIKENKLKEQIIYNLKNNEINRNIKILENDGRYKMYI